MSASRARWYVIFATCIVVCVLVVMGRAVTEARSELEAARGYDQAGASLRAIEHYRRALRWSFPFSPYTPEAVSRLEGIAEELERGDDIDGALFAWRSLAGGLAAARFLYSPTNPSRENAKDEIARLLGEHGATPIDSNLDADRLAAEHRRLLDQDATPDWFWGTILLAGFLVWTLSLVWMTRRGFDSHGRLHWREARWPASSALVGLVSFVLGLLFA